MSADRSQIGASAASRTDHVAVRAHVVRSGKVLLARSQQGDRLWTTLGGRPEPGESLEEALRRELREELGIDAMEFERLPDRKTTWEGDRLSVAVFVVT